ncbi:tRNA preQ1(34) S-adenosylmethionine ribosyltransferase-isomerase QueA [candidate division KSB1 bacterium]|nr:tRNA preQ1(34) S-adenosylmethionine ribosyltransferase-isomerase QueA [candidate division KSB1 bacterium]
MRLPLNLSDFDYFLPSELIAQTAVTPRSTSRLMVLKGDDLEHRRFYQLPEYLQQGDVIAINQSRVMKNKLIGRKSTGAAAEMILMQPVDENTVRCRIKCSRVRVGNVFEFDDLLAEVVEQQNDIFIVQFNRPVKEIVDHYLYPNPPYIHRAVGEEYQTVYARTPGSLAAPTAGLHFTPHLIRRIKAMGVQFATVTLHVGFGTFLPVRDTSITGHRMEAEYFEITPETAQAIQNANRLFVVGTTTLKALETSAQETGQIQPGKGWSELFIYPGYRFRMPVKGLVTNFHLPKSTLMLLVSAFYGRERVLAAYAEAVKQRYRFFSLGDATLMLK